MKGKCRVEKLKGNALVHIMDYEPGNHFGELALLVSDMMGSETGLRAASVVAKGTCTCAELHKPAFLQFIARSKAGQIILHECGYSSDSGVESSPSESEEDEEECEARGLLNSTNA